MERRRSRHRACRPRPRRLRPGRAAARALSGAGGVLASHCGKSIGAMPGSDFEVVVVGGGAAGVAAARRLCDVSIRGLLVEARPRLGGRAWTWTDASGFALDLGCGWLHSADRNPWVRVALAQRCTIDRTPPPWARPSAQAAFSASEQASFLEALMSFRPRVDSIGESEPDRAAVTAV